MIIGSDGCSFMIFGSLVIKGMPVETVAALVEGSRTLQIVSPISHKPKLM
jgi:hypothetical protein